MKLATFSFKLMLLKNKPSSLGSNVRSLLLRGEAASRHSPLSLHSQLPWRLWAECQKFQLRFITERLPHQQTSGAPSLGSPRPHCPGLLWLYREDLQTVHKALPPIKEFHSPAWVIFLWQDSRTSRISLSLSLSLQWVWPKSGSDLFYDQFLSRAFYSLWCAAIAGGFCMCTALIHDGFERYRQAPL